MLVVLKGGTAIGGSEESVYVEDTIYKGLDAYNISQKEEFINEFTNISKVDLIHKLSGETKSKFQVNNNVKLGNGKVCNYYYTEGVNGDATSKKGGHIKTCKGKGEVQEVMMSIGDSRIYEKGGKGNQKYGEQVLKYSKDTTYATTDYKGYSIEYGYVIIGEEKNLLSVRINKN